MASTWCDGVREQSAAQEAADAAVGLKALLRARR
jgi:hypothetical protein